MQTTSRFVFMVGQNQNAYEIWKKKIKIAQKLNAGSADDEWDGNIIKMVQMPNCIFSE